MTEREKNGLICFSDIFFGKWKLLILYELADGLNGQRTSGHKSKYFRKGFD